MNQHHGPLRPRSDLLAHAAPDKLLELRLLVRQHDQRRRVELLRGPQDRVSHALAAGAPAAARAAAAGELVHDVDGERVGRESAVCDQARELAADERARGALERVPGLVGAAERRGVVERARGGGGGADARDDVEEVDDVFFWFGGGGSGGGQGRRRSLCRRRRLQSDFLSILKKKKKTWTNCSPPGRYI